MKVNSVKENNGVIKSVFIAYFILLLHILLLAGLGVLIIFFKGIVNYMLWIFLAGTGIVIFSAYRFYRKMKKERKTLKEMMNSPLFRGREVEISLLGGLASLKVGKPQNLLLENYQGDIKQLEDPETMRLKELNELVRLFENNLITLEEYNQAKKQIFNP
ncbi:MAG TPA: hypothetical protein VK872_08200, partial [Draconibacterium sp.]|nr:hypothetical protein [Draconibacterium sp.]